MEAFEGLALIFLGFEQRTCSRAGGSRPCHTQPKAFRLSLHRANVDPSSFDEVVAMFLLSSSHAWRENPVIS